ncbi:MAG: alpha/beta hydrolase family protein [Sporichthyaceae bacterium]
MRGLRRVWLTAVFCAGALAASLTACSSDAADEPVSPLAALTPAPTLTQPAQTPAPPSSASAQPDLPPVTEALSLPALMREDFPPGRIRLRAEQSRNAAYTRSRVTYDAGGLTISGILLRPRGPGPFPGIVLNHGYIDPDVYVTGQGLAREQDRLARAGFVVLHTDYRGHAASDDGVGRFDLESRLGYARDAIHAVLALEREPYVDPDRMAMLGRSMGGGVTLNALVARPDLVEAAVIYASVSSNYVDNLDQFTLRSRPDAAEDLFERYGTPAQSPEFYDALSPRTYFDRISDPLLIHHGRVDDTCPYRWATATQRALRAAGADSELLTYDGEGHSFFARHADSMDRTIRFLREKFAQS